MMRRPRLITADGGCIRSCCQCATASPRPKPVRARRRGISGRGQSRCEPSNAVAEVGDGRVEASGITSRDRSGTNQCTAARPPSSSRARSQTVTTRSSSCWTWLMGRGRSRGSGRWWRRRRRSRRDRSRARGGCRPNRRDGAGPAPQRGGQVRPGRVGGAHEQHPPRRLPRRCGRGVHGAGDQLQVGATPVTFGPVAGNDPGLLQHVQVMRQQVRRHRQHRGQFGRGGVARQQPVGDGQPGRVGQRGVHRGAPGQVGSSLS